MAEEVRVNFLDSRLYQIAKVLADFLILNLLWLTACLPILTIFPATAAMFGVCREWSKGRNSDPIETYLVFFRGNARRSLCIGLIWAAVGGLFLANYAILAANYTLIRDLPVSAKLPLYAWSALTGLTYLFASVYLFPVMVNYDTSCLGVLKNSVILSLSRPITTILCALILGIAVVLLRYFPVALALMGSATAYVIYRLCDRTFTYVATSEQQS